MAVIEDPIERTSKDLLDRLAKESARPPGTAPTHRAGGVTKVGSALELLLRALLIETAGIDGVPAVALLPTIGTRAVSIERATGGQLVRALQALRIPTRERPLRVKAILDDIQQPRSVIRGVIEIRNDVAHGGAVPVRLADALRDLKELVILHRKQAGWA
jgi:hypothetical protein